MLFKISYSVVFSSCHVLIVITSKICQSKKWFLCFNHQSQLRFPSFSLSLNQFKFHVFGIWQRTLGFSVRIQVKSGTKVSVCNYWFPYATILNINLTSIFFHRLCILSHDAGYVGLQFSTCSLSFLIYSNVGFCIKFLVSHFT